MTPAQAIAALDRQIARHGQDVRLRASRSETAAFDETVRAFVRGYKAEELGGGVQQGDTLMLLSPTELERVRFGPVERGCQVMIGDRQRYIEIADPVVLGDVLVRVECTVRG